MLIFVPFPARAPRRRNKRRRGFMLLDALLALSVATLLILYGLSLMMTASSASDAAKQTTLAYNAARQQIENVRALRSAPLKNQTKGALIGPMPQLTELNGGAGTLTIQDYNGPVKKATVEISWRAGGMPQNRTISVTTLVAPGGVTP